MTVETSVTNSLAQDWTNLDDLLSARSTDSQPFTLFKYVCVSKQMSEYFNCKGGMFKSLCASTEGAFPPCIQVLRHFSLAHEHLDIFPFGDKCSVKCPSACMQGEKTLLQMSNSLLDRETILLCLYWRTKSTWVQGERCDLCSQKKGKTSSEYI